MNEFPVAKARSSLTSKGLEGKRRDHFNFFYVHEGKKTRIHTRCSHGRTISLKVLRQMRKQLRLEDMESLQRLLDCSMDADEYATILKEKNLI